MYLPETVRKEVEKHREFSFELSDISWSSVTSPTCLKDQSLLTACQIYSLDRGETEAIAIINEKPQTMLLTDDAAARLVAKELGFEVHGTIGVLIRSIRRGLMGGGEVINLLEKLPELSTLYIKKKLLQEIIVQVREQFDS